MISVPTRREAAWLMVGSLYFETWRVLLKCFHKLKLTAVTAVAVAKLIAGWLVAAVAMQKSCPEKANNIAHVFVAVDMSICTLPHCPLEHEPLAFKAMYPL